ncbi:MAG TPA: hypothetical protein ENN24_01835, partial [Bacteroidetes bacterium]|nr:hypothetical protein [Bacteroidota bacterium]
MRKFLFLSLAAIVAVSLVSCEKEVDERESDELLRLQAYMSIHYPNVEPTKSGLYYIIEHDGEGATPADGDYLLFDYTGQNLDDYVFETTIQNTAYLHDLFSTKTHYTPKYTEYKSETASMIKGLEEGFSYLKEGSVARFIMPSSLAYGSNRYRGLYPYSSVIFDIELKKVVSDPEAYEQQLIEEYIAENYPELAIEDILIDGIYFLETSIFEGEDEEDVPETIEEEDTVELDYTGSFLDEWVFDTSIIEVAQENDIFETGKDYSPINVTVGGSGYIEGFSLALKNSTTLSTIKIIIPSQYA